VLAPTRASKARVCAAGANITILVSASASVALRAMTAVAAGL
jgi:tRNA threonylcarbamoyladenosine modification (KEOPS) complex  Pcc1 subunit